MMYHHDSRPYEEAASEAAQHFRTQIMARVEAGKKTGREQMERLRREVPRDVIMSGKGLSFGLCEGRIVATVKPFSDEPDGMKMTLHNNALGQLIEDAPVVRPPRAYMTALLSAGGVYAQHAVDTLSTHYRTDNEKHLLRVVETNGEDQLRGFLSTKYRRRDTRFMVQSFLAACSEVGALPYETVVTDTKVMIKAIVAKVFEPVTNEILAFGLTYEDSEYGNGKTRTGVFMERGWCTNKAIMSSELAEVHLGSRLQGDVAWSEVTVKRDTEATASAIRDIVSGGLSQTKINQLCGMVEQASKEEVQAKDVQAYFDKALGKEKGREASKMFASAETKLLPPGQTLWRFANVLDFFAQETQADAEERQELQKLAGDLLMPKPEKKQRARA